MGTLTGTRMTADEFLAMEESDGYELVHGRPEEVPMGALSSWVGGELFFYLRSFLGQHPLGRVFPQETAVKAWPDDNSHFRKPDGMFVSNARLIGIAPETLEAVPDLVFEVVSPTDEAQALEKKLGEYFDAGVRLVWVIYPQTKTVHIYRPGGLAAYIGPGDVLSGEDVLPGFSVPVKDLFPSS